MNNNALIAMDKSGSFINSSSGTVFPAIGCSGAHMAVYFS